MAYEIVERCQPAEMLAFLGIRTRGVFLAERLRQTVGRILGRELPGGTIDVTLYRDDLAGAAATRAVEPTEIPFEIDGHIVVLVDDVLFTGRTTRAALDQIIDFGRPAAVRLAVLVDRGGRELPIQADFIGKTLTLTDAEERVLVHLAENDGEEGIFLS
jgi:pyrimidine operon attenuation protein/uracil phosphoribosyltransferase